MNRTNFIKIGKRTNGAHKVETEIYYTTNGAQEQGNYSYPAIYQRIRDSKELTVIMSITEAIEAKNELTKMINLALDGVVLCIDRAIKKVRHETQVDMYFPELDHNLLKSGFAGISDRARGLVTRDEAIGVLERLRADILSKKLEER